MQDVPGNLRLIGLPERSAELLDDGIDIVLM